MRFCFLDWWYKDAFAAANTRDYDKLHEFCHGTSNYFDIALRAAGHESDTLIGNAENDILGKAVAMQPDVICSQNVGLYYPALIRARGFKGKLVAFCSYAAERANLTGWDVIFSSFRWLVDALNRNGQRAVYLPLAFGRAVLERVEAPKERDLPVTFVGGLGHKIWQNGTDDIAAVARAFPNRFRWFGYRVGQLPDELNATYGGEVWGRDYWRTLMRSVVTINRHGEIAKGEGPQNMREWESGGVGTFLLSDVGNTRLGTVRYRSKIDLIAAVARFMDCPQEAIEKGKAAQIDTHINHCYESRVPAFIDALGAV